MYIFHASSNVPNAEIWKEHSPKSCPVTGKGSEVLKARRTRQAELHNQKQVDQFRMTMVRISNAQHEDDRTVVHPDQIQAILDRLLREVQCIQIKR